MFHPLWSEPILDEVQRNLPNVGVSPERAIRRVGMMGDAFGAEALIEDFGGLIEAMTCDPRTGTCWPRRSEAALTCSLPST